MLKSLSVSGYCSIETIENLELNNINVLIGPNGAGKSNFLSIFRMLSYMLSGDGLQSYIAKLGGADDLLHDGSAKTKTMNFDFCFTTERGTNEYSFSLEYTNADRLYFTREQFRFLPEGVLEGSWTSLGKGHEEAKLIDRADFGQVTAKFILQFMRRIKLYQFHNTSNTSRIRQTNEADENPYLREDGANLAAMFLDLQNNYPKHYRRLISELKIIWPQFAELVLIPDKNNYIRLRWREKDSDKTFGIHQASDGTLRLLCLLFLLMQPKEKRPEVLLLDEPELGLHPAAIGVVAGRIRAAALEGTQIILATQSPLFLNYFSPNDVIVLDRKGRSTTAHRMSTKRLELWLNDYSLSEIWQKNVEGGNP